MSIFEQIERGYNEHYDGEEGLARFETALGLAAKGDASRRIKSAVAEIERLIGEWEQTRTIELLRDHTRFNAVFTLMDRADMYAYLRNREQLGAVGDAGLTWPDCWWGRLAYEVEARGLWERLWGQIHRETNAKLAAPTLKEERSIVASRNGKRAGLAAKKKAANWHADCVSKARELLKQGKAPHELAGILATRYGKTARQVRTVLQQAGDVK